MKLRAKTNEELAQEHIEFLYNPSPEWVEYFGFQEHYDKVDGEYYLKKEERSSKSKQVKLLDSSHNNETIAEVEKDSQDRA